MTVSGIINIGYAHSECKKKEPKQSMLNRLRPSTRKNDLINLILIHLIFHYLGEGVVVFNATFNNISVISWRSVVLVEKTLVSGDNMTCRKSSTNFIS